MLHICPYHYSKAVINDVDLLIVPYNYVLSESARSGLELKNKYIIFDECHNVESFAEKCYSFEIK